MLHTHFCLPVRQSAAAADFPGLGGTGGVKGCTDSSGHFQWVSSLLLRTFSVLFWFLVCVCVWGKGVFVGGVQNFLFNLEFSSPGVNSPPLPTLLLFLFFLFTLSDLELAM